MKALSLTQPWASLVAIGAKRIETRSWGTLHRGPLAIHASKGFPRWARDFCEQPEFAEALQRGGLSVHTLPRGCIIAKVSLVTCVQLGKHQALAATGLAHVFRTHNIAPQPEYSFGDYSAGRWVWVLERAEPINPVSISGALSLWEWTED